jgi:NAD(P)-dependent dehydrogenase (short-subunit alcohol dehydrogenase family)
VDAHDGGAGGSVAEYDFTGRTVLVTGGSRGVGHRLVEAFLAAGADVVTCGRHEPDPGDLPTRSGPDGVERTALFHETDVRQADQAKELVAFTTDRFGRLDVLVNNAGGSPYKMAADITANFATAITALNLFGPFFCAQAANEVMQAQEGGGSIINITSISGIRATPGAAFYGAAKAGLLNLTQTLSVEWAPAVRVNCVTAGLLDTGSGEDHYGGPEGLARVAATIPLGRLGTPDDVVGPVFFLASPASAFVTGSSLLAHGGDQWPAYIAAAAG